MLDNGWSIAAQLSSSGSQPAISQLCHHLPESKLTITFKIKCRQEKVLVVVLTSGWFHSLFIASGNKIMTLLRSCTKLLHSPTTPTLPCNMQCHAAVSCSPLPDSLQNKAFHHHHHFLHFAMLNAELISGHYVQCCHNAPCLPALCATGAALPSAILLPASARLQQIQRQKSAVLQLQAETRKNMRRHFSVHNISFIAPAPAPAPGLCSVRGCVCMTSLILASSGVSSLTPGAGLCWYFIPRYS